MPSCPLRLVFGCLALSVLSAERPQNARAQVNVDARSARSVALRPPAQPPRPATDSAQEAGRRLLQAIVHDDPQLAAEAFFPRAAFVQVKAMQKPERYYDKLFARFVDDIH